MSTPSNVALYQARRIDTLGAYSMLIMNVISYVTICTVYDKYILQNDLSIHSLVAWRLDGGYDSVVLGV
jgi:hypothetical protein